MKQRIATLSLILLMFVGVFISVYGYLNPVIRTKYLRSDTGEEIQISGNSETSNTVITPEIPELEKRDENDVVNVAKEYWYKNEEYADKLAAYQVINEDVIGYIKIDGTNLNHPVVQTPGDEGYYLRRSLNKQRNSHGVPFLDEDNHIDGFEENLILYGHAITQPKPDSFGELQRYESVNYYKKHPYIELTTEKGTRRWVIIAAFLVDTKEDFQYSEYDIFDNLYDWEDWYEGVQKRNWLSVDIPAEYGDTFMSLSTCSYEEMNSETSRMCVVAKLMNTSEDYSHQIEAATQAESPLMPKTLSWYKVSQSRWVKKYMLDS